MHTYFKKSFNCLVISKSGHTHTMANCILVSRQYNSGAKHLKAILGEEVVSKHYLLVTDFLIAEVKVEEKI